MNSLIVSDQKSFTSDSRTNYINYNKSNIFNTDIKPHQNNLVDVMIKSLLFYFRISKINSKKKNMNQNLLLKTPLQKSSKI